MTLINTPVKTDMLTISSTVQEILRAMYLYSADYILLIIARKERLLHKDQLVCLLEQGREGVALSDLISEAPKEPLAARTQMEDTPQSTPLLLFAQGELSRTSFGEYREQKITDTAAKLPEWWDVPLPLIYVSDQDLSLNNSALTLIPGGAKALAEQIDGLLKERIITLHEKKTDRTLTLSPLTDSIYFLEDISGDFEMAEDLLWWAAAGRAFVRRMEKNGLVVHRLSPYEQEPENAAEIIPCFWEGELMGKLSIEIAAKEDAPPQGGEKEAEQTKAGEAEARRNKRSSQRKSEKNPRKAPDPESTAKS